MEFAVVFEPCDSGWGAIVLDLPGCVSLGKTLEEVQRNVQEAIELYLEVLKERGEAIPEPRHQVGRVQIAA